MTLVYRILLMDFGGRVGKTFYLCFHNLSFARIHCIQPVYLGGATRKMSEDSNIVWYGMGVQNQLTIYIEWKIQLSLLILIRGQPHFLQLKVDLIEFPT